MQMPNNLAYYIRLSLADFDVGGASKDESNSVKNQRDLILSYIDSHPEFQGWQIHEFVDDGYTGTNDDRPNFQRLIDLTRKGQIQCIIVKDLSRFARNYIITGNYLEQVFPFLGVRFIAINDNYDSANSQSVEDNMSVVLKSVLNTYYSKDLSRKITASFIQRMRQGTYKAAAPFGYIRRKEAVAFEINPPAAEIIQRIFTLALAGRSRKEIANLLNEEGLPTPAVFNARCHNGLHNRTSTALDHALWEPSMLLPILRNPVYCGDRVLRKNVSVTPGSKKRRPARPEEQIIIKDAHEPIISRKDFDKVQKMLPAKKSCSHRNSSLDYTLKGAVRCGICKRSMTRAKNYSVFICSHAKLEHSRCSKKEFPIPDIEQAVFASLKPMLQIAASAGRRLQKKGAKASAEAYLTDYQKAIADSEYSLRRIRQRSLDIYEAYSRNELTLDQYSKQKTELAQEKKKHTKQLDSLKSQEAALTNGIIPVEMQTLTETARQFQHGTSLTREMVTSFVEAVYLYDSHIEIVWKYQDIWNQLKSQEGENTNDGYEENTKQAPAAP